LDEPVKPEYAPFGSSEEWGTPEIHEFTGIFPEFPKTHVNGYAYIIDLDERVLNEKAIADLRNALQYSQTGGKGRSPRANVQFFQKEKGLPVPMTHWVRQCAGISSDLLLIYRCTTYLIVNGNRF
jgi:hypothetical protein